MKMNSVTDTSPEEVSPEEDAADDAVIAAIGAVAAKHKPEHMMFMLGVLFAQGLAYYCSEKARDEALKEFVYRLKKYCGVVLERAANQDTH
jgi:hypothetical protein